MGTQSRAQGTHTEPPSSHQHPGLTTDSVVCLGRTRVQGLTSKTLRSCSPDFWEAVGVLLDDVVGSTVGPFRERLDLRRCPTEGVDLFREHPPEATEAVTER